MDGFELHVQKARANEWGQCVATVQVLLECSERIAERVSGRRDVHGVAGTAAANPVLAAPNFARRLLGTARASNAMQRFAAVPAPVRGVAYCLAIVYLALFVPVGAGTFIYQQF